MMFHRVRAWGLAFVIVAAASAAAPAAPVTGATIPVGDYNAIRIPGDAPVRFDGMSDEDEAHFAGEFVLTGSYEFGCIYVCDQLISLSDLTLLLRPDAQVAERLPRWTSYRKGVEVVILDPGSFIDAVITQKQKSLLLSGKLDHVSGRTSIRVKDLVLSIECDSPRYTVHFVGFADARKRTTAQNATDFGCL